MLAPTRKGRRTGNRRGLVQAKPRQICRVVRKPHVRAMYSSVYVRYWKEFASLLNSDHPGAAVQVHGDDMAKFTMREPNVGTAYAKRGVAKKRGQGA